MNILKGKKPYPSSNQSAQCDNSKSLILSPLKQRGRAKQMCRVKMITTQAIFKHVINKLTTKQLYLVMAYNTN